MSIGAIEHGRNTKCTINIGWLDHVRECSKFGAVGEDLQTYLVSSFPSRIKSAFDVKLERPYSRIS